MLENLKCLLGHDYRYNFPSIPNRCICARCKAKFELNLRTQKWNRVDSFNIKDDTRTDDELIKQWVK